jgi:tetratricopeptide (TPR) repeat protein
MKKAKKRSQKNGLLFLSAKEKEVLLRIPNGEFPDDNSCTPLILKRKFAEVEKKLRLIVDGLLATKAYERKGNFIPVNSSNPFERLYTILGPGSDPQAVYAEVGAPISEIAVSLGIALRLQGQCEEGMEYIKAGVDLAPCCPDRAMDYNESFLFTGNCNSDFQEQMAGTDKVLKMCYTCNQLARAYFDYGEFACGQEDYEKAEYVATMGYSDAPESEDDPGIPPHGRGFQCYDYGNYPMDYCPGEVQYQNSTLLKSIAELTGGKPKTLTTEERKAYTLKVPGIQVGFSPDIFAALSDFYKLSLNVFFDLKKAEYYALILAGISYTLPEELKQIQPLTIPFDKRLISERKTEKFMASLKDGRRYLEYLSQDQNGPYAGFKDEDYMDLIIQKKMAGLQDVFAEYNRQKDDYYLRLARVMRQRGHDRQASYFEEIHRRRKDEYVDWDCHELFEAK